MDIFSVKSVDELKKCGKLHDVKNEIKNMIGTDVKIKMNTWNNLYTSIISLKRIAAIMNNVNISGKESNDLYFKGDAEKYIYYLLELDGKPRLDKLGINRTHYSNKNIADKWRNDILKVIHPDICKHRESNKAMAELNEMYKEMVK